MKTSSNGINFIEKEEGVILYAYDDATEKRVASGGNCRGTITIGTGHTSAAGPPRVIPGMTITKQQADAILAGDLYKVEAQVNSLVKAPINQNQFDAIVSFQFNTGGLARSSVLTKLNKKDYTGASEALLAWSKGNGNPNLLLGRRKREQALFNKPAPSKVTSGFGGIIASAASGAMAFYHWGISHWIEITASAAFLAILGGILIHLYRKK